MEERQRRQLKALLVNLERVDYEMASGTLIFKIGGSEFSGIYYSKINGIVALRPRCCIGPELTSQEFEKECEISRRRQVNLPLETTMAPSGRAEILTYLERVRKKDGKEDPGRIQSTAPTRMREIQENRRYRRRVTMHHGRETA